MAVKNETQQFCPYTGPFRAIEMAPILKRMGVTDRAVRASFHPTEPIIALACGPEDGKIVILNGCIHSTPISQWKIELVLNYMGSPCDLQWNVDGTQLAVLSSKQLAIFRYPSGQEALTQDFDGEFCIMSWNPFNHDLLVLYVYYYYTRASLIKNTRNQGKHKLEFIFKFKCYSVEWISQNVFACKCLNNENIEFYEIDNRGFKLMKTIQIGGHFWPHELRWDKKFQYLACAGPSAIQVWSMEISVNPIFNLETPDGNYCTSLAWRSSREYSDGEPNSPLLTCGLKNGSVVVWLPLDPSNESIYLNGPSEITKVSFSPDGQFLASSTTSQVMIWGVKNWQKLCNIKLESKNISPQMSWDATGEKIAVYDQSGRLNVRRYTVTINKSK